MSSINSVRNLQILYFSKKNKESKKLKKNKKKWARTPIYTYYCLQHHCILNTKKIEQNFCYM